MQNHLSKPIILFVLIISCMGLIFPPRNIKAELQVVSKSEVNFDTSILAEAESYRTPKSIILMPVFTEFEGNISSKDWYKGLLYYFSSDRFNFKDIPVHYVVAKSGEIFEGINGGAERVVLIEDGPADPIVILYLANKGDTQFSVNSLGKLKELIQLLVNENEIKPTVDSVQFKNLKLEKISATKQVNLVGEEVFGIWVSEFARIVEQISAEYAPRPKQYTVAVSELALPTEPVEIGSESVVSIKIKNTGRNVIFAGSDSELILAKNDSSTSSFFINNSWISKSEIPLMKDSEVLRPSEEKVVEIKLAVPLLPGQYSESFILRTAGGQVVSPDQIRLGLNITKGNNNVLEIISTETGSLNVRQNPSIGSGLVTKVSIGQRFIWTDSQLGWYKIKVENQEGWVLGKYVRVI